MMQQIKKIADEIIKIAVDQKHILTLEFDKNSIKNLKNVFNPVKGFVDIIENIQFQVAITIKEDTNVVDFEAQLNNVLKTKSLTNVKFQIIRNAEKSRIRSGK